MSLIKKIKDKILTVEAYLRSNNAMKSVATIRMSKQKRKIKLINTINNVNLTNKICLNDEDNQENKKLLHIIIGCNQGMCGSFLLNIHNYVRNLIKKITSNEKIYIIGEKFSDFSLHSKIKVDKLKFTDIDLFNLGCSIYNHGLTEKVNLFVLHYFEKNEFNKVSFDIRPNLNENLQIYEMLNFIFKLMGAVFVSSFYENKDRIIALEQAKTNAEKMHRKGINEMNRSRQEMITNDLAEIVSGVLL